MIIFKKIRYKNFLSTGNTPIEIDLDKSPTTLIIGKNGSGKSTLLDALCWALFNKPFRIIKKEQMINLIGKFVKDLKENKRGRIKEVANKFPDVDFYEGKKPWGIEADVAFPCATQNEIELSDAKDLVKNGVATVCEGANMPSTKEAVDVLLAAKIAYGPGKAANAGGVATSQLEMAQNASMQMWTFEEVDTKLQQIMKNIFDTASNTAAEFDQPGNLVLGANIAAFRRVADAMIEQGVV